MPLIRTVSKIMLIRTSALSAMSIFGLVCLLILSMPSSFAENNNKTSTALSSQSTAIVLEINSAIGPAVQDYIHRGILRANEQKAELVIIKMNTPGGLDPSMRGIITDILASSIPIVTYVAPSGARAASAGTFILYASHIAAMSPGTNLGAATPVDLLAPTQEEDQDLNSKQQQTKKPPKSVGKQDSKHLKAINDAKAYIRSLAELRKRNVKWAESAVATAESLSATEALREHVIDVVAKDIPDLLQQINQKTVEVAHGVYTINTHNIKLTTLQPDWITHFLTIITDPSVAYILLMIGFYGLLFEFMNPGFILPGVVGAICFLIGLYALHLLPINYAGLFLILLGLSFVIAEIFMPSYGSLGLGGIIAFLVGSMMLFKSSSAGFNLPISTIITVTVLTGLFFVLILQLTWRSQRRPIVSGKEWLIGKTGEVIIDQDRVWVLVLGEYWQAHSSLALHHGQTVKIVAVNDLVLEVIPVNSDIS